MLLLVTIGLVVVGAVALVIGFVSNSLGPIYISIACSVIAGVVLVVFSRMARRGDAGGSAIAGPASASPGSWSPAPATPPPATTPAPSPTAGFRPPAASPPPPPPVRRREPEPTITMHEPVREDEAFEAPAPAAAMLDGDDDFPIAGYDKLRASQIVAQLADLDLDELDMVQEREEQTKNRATVLRQVVSRIDALEAEDADGAPSAPEPVPVVDEFPAAAPHEFPADDDGFPIADYDQLSADEIIAVLDDLEDEELDMVAEREEMGQNRAEILDYIDDMFEEVDAGAPEPARAGAAATAPPAPRSATKTTPAKKVAAKKVAVKKVAVKKAAPAGRRAAAAPAAKAPARKAATTKATAKAAPAKAAAASAASSPGTKSAGRRTAASPAAEGPVAGASKKAATKRAPAKKAAATTRKR